MLVWLLHLTLIPKQIFKGHLCPLPNPSLTKSVFCQIPIKCWAYFLKKTLEKIGFKNEKKSKHFN